ncbi:hypothetical protein [Ruminococcus difficilis]|uniref:Uncharacterized protein n=1 Tax=Ruminococcus difficilis TaxID=2763069 RepID=A0A934WQQ3_9FIRM|nr:hypothetical protein [Ruminococcus difficilis]MBK6087124.1 hypothetical protein [Ruminococcus difficilis]
MKKKYYSPEIDIISLSLTKDTLSASKYTEAPELETHGGNDVWGGDFD